LSSTVQELSPSWKGKVAFVYLALNVPEDKRLAEKLGNATPTTLIFIKKNGKVAEVKKGLQDRKTIEAGLSTLVR
jgi:hypothetical protein